MLNSLDATDRNIIDILRKNSRTAFLSIAKTLNLSESTIRKRVANLESRGIIQKFSLIVDPSKLGYENVAYIGVDAEPEKYLEVANDLKQDPQIKCLSTSVGDHMFMLEVWAKDNEELQQICDRIKSNNKITRICPAVIKETL